MIHFDGGDIDNYGCWYGREICCLACRETVALRLGVNRIFMCAELECECGEPFAEVWL